MLCHQSNTFLITLCISNDGFLNEYQLQDVKLLRDEGQSLPEIKDELERKYVLYNFSFFKENEKDDVGRYFYTTYQNGARRFEVELTELSDDDLKKQELTMFVVPKSDEDEIQDANEFLDSKIDSDSYRAKRPIMSSLDQEINDGETLKEKWNDILYSIKANSNEDEKIKLARILENFAVVMFSTDADSELTGLHHEIETNLIDGRSIYEDQFTEYKDLNGYRSHNWLGRKYWSISSNPISMRDNPDLVGATLGFLYNFNHTSNYNCVNGRTIPMSYESSYPFCLCDYGFGGSECDVPLASDNIISDAMNVAQLYKVPGMFDLQDQISAVADTIKNQIDEQKEEIFTEIRSVSTGVQQNHNAIMSAQSIILNEIQAQSSVMLSEFQNLQAAMEAALKKEADNRIYQSNQATSHIVNVIVETASEITDALVSLDRKVVENRYFDELSLHIPVFQQMFLFATKNDSSDETRQEFSDYMHLHQHYFYVSREAVAHAITGKPDSYLRSQMNGYMVSGCTEEYNEKIQSVWQMLYKVHTSTYVMEYWDLDYKIEKAEELRDHSQASTIRHEKKYIEQKAAISAELFRNERSASCREFLMEEMLGGGCREGLTFPGQTIRNIKCTDENKSIVLSTTGEAINDMQCGEDSEWSIDVSELKCAQNCQHEGVYYAIGEARKLPDPAKGHQWLNADGEVVTESICQYLASDNAGEWTSYEETDIDECLTFDCGDDGSCSNLDGSYTCNCPSGFVENPLTGCEDINECVFGGEGSIACLMDRALGQCINTIGGYECVCLIGAYAPSDANSRECRECLCNEEGVVPREYCDGTTGQCLCQERVGGEDCGSCIAGYTNFPHCNQCDAGYYGYPNCQTCECSLEGTTAEICNPRDGDCICRDWAKGRRCDKCCSKKKCNKDFTPFPACEPIYRNGTLTNWGEWGLWEDEGSCGHANATGYDIVRRRTRKCKDKKKSVHGFSCDNADLEETESYWKPVCKHVTRVYGDLDNGLHSMTTGKFYFAIRQGSTSCETDTVAGPILLHNKGEEFNKEGDFGCENTFDTTKRLELRMLLDSRDGSAYHKIGVKTGDDWWYHDPADKKSIDNDDGREWHTIIPKTATNKLSSYLVTFSCDERNRMTETDPVQVWFKIKQYDVTCMSNHDMFGNVTDCGIKEEETSDTNGCKDEWFQRSEGLAVRWYTDSPSWVYISLFKFEMTPTEGDQETYMWPSESTVSDKDLKIKSGQPSNWRTLNPMET